jgi:hypothetical protein
VSAAGDAESQHTVNCCARASFYSSELGVRSDSRVRARGAGVLARVAFAAQLAKLEGMSKDVPMYQTGGRVPSATSDASDGADGFNPAYSEW